MTNRNASQKTRAESASDHQLEDFLEFAHRLADLSGARILSHFRNLEAISNKAAGGDFDPVTAADREAEQAIREAIEAAYPDHGIVGEEYGDRQARGDRRWIVDPIDGTRAFITGSPLWGTLIGLLESGHPVLGMMNQPFTGERFWAGGQGAHYSGPGGDRVLATRSCPSLDDATLSTTSPDLFSEAGEWERFEAVSARVRARRFGGDCYGYCLLAAGHLDLIIETGLKPFDIAPLIPIIEQAGGRVTAWDGSDAASGGRIVAAGDPGLHEDVLKLLATG